MKDEYVPPLYRPLDGHDGFEDDRCEYVVLTDYAGQERDRCPAQAEFIREGTEITEGALLCFDHARADVMREALERIAYPNRHPKGDPNWSYLAWSESVASNALSFGASSYVPARGARSGG